MNHIILAAGTNTRFKHPNIKVKTLSYLCKKSLLQYQIEYQNHLPINKTYIVVNQNALSSFKKIKEEFPYIEFIIQKSGSSLIDGLKVTSNLSGTTLLSLGDEFIFKPNFKEFENALKNDQMTIFFEPNCSSKEVEKTYSFIKQDNFGSSFLEKPTNPETNYRGTGHLIFSHKCFELVKDLPDNIDDIAKLLNFISLKGHLIYTSEVGEMYHNINTVEDYNVIIKKYGS